MEAPVISKILFTITFPARKERRHIPHVKMLSLFRGQLPDLDVIDTIDHLFKCQRCFENYRRVRRSQIFPKIRSASAGRAKGSRALRR